MDESGKSPQSQTENFSPGAGLEIRVEPVAQIEAGEEARGKQKNHAGVNGQLPIRALPSGAVGFGLP
jgi:hypothetical protein